jgi:hypothetical protein
MNSFPHIEDYIEIIVGYRQADGTVSNNFLINSLINLARYDISVLQNLAETSFFNQVAYTDRQAQLAHRLVVKYERQLRRNQVDISTIRDTPKFRYEPRVVDRSKRAWIDNNKIKIKFPFDAKAVDKIRAASNISQGCIEFDRTDRIWTLDLTEYNVYWAMLFCESQEIEVDAEIKELQNQILEIEQLGPAMQLQGPVPYHITSADPALISYIESKVGGFGPQHLLDLVDNSASLGYSVAPNLLDSLRETMGPKEFMLLTNHWVKAKIENEVDSAANAVANYAKLTNRLPIHLYSPTPKQAGVELCFHRYLDPEQIIMVPLPVLDMAQQIKEQPPKLLVSTVGMTSGSRNYLIQKSEKVVFFAHSVYNYKNNDVGISTLS